MKEIFEEVIKQLNLGNNLLGAEPIHGGALHKMWRIETERQVFAIKEINSHVASRRSFWKHHETTENIANTFYQNHIPAVCALKINQHFVNKCLNNFFIVYPYIGGNVIQPDQLNEQQLDTIGSLFSKMHLLDIDVEGVETPYYDIFDNDYWTTLLSQQDTSTISSCLANLIDWNDKYHEAIPFLNKKLVITHRDMHPSNILWDNHRQPHVIDWEAAGLMNPMLEIVGYGLEWGGIISGTFVEKNTKHILEAYKKYNRSAVSKEEIEHAFYGWIGNCVMGWTEFNVRRMSGETSTDPKEIKIGKDIIQNKMNNCINYIAAHENELINLAYMALK